MNKNGKYIYLKQSKTVWTFKFEMVTFMKLIVINLSGNKFDKNDKI